MIRTRHRAIITIVSALFIWHCVNAQKDLFPIDPNTGKITYSDSVPVPGASRASLFEHAITWFSYDLWTKAQCVIIQRSSESGTIMASLRFRVVIPDNMAKQSPGYVDLDFFLNLDEGRYHYDISNFNLGGSRGSKFWSDLREVKAILGTNKDWRRIRNVAHSTTTALVQSFTQHMQTIGE